MVHGEMSTMYVDTEKYWTYSRVSRDSAASTTVCFCGMIKLFKVYCWHTANFTVERK